MTTSLGAVGTAAAPLSAGRVSSTASFQARSRGKAVPVAIAIGVVAVVSAVVWATTSWTQTASQIASVDKFVVAPQTFNVVLKEKGELKAAKSTDIKCEVEGKSTIITLIEE